MEISLTNYLMLFFIYSFLGWVMEVIVTLIEDKKLINRGFLIGPLCPIYGWGCIGIILLLSKYMGDPIVLFVMSFVICSLLEYFTSYFMEKLFKARWWDYSHKKFNINGRICLEHLFAFGVLGLLMIYCLNPFFVNLLLKFNESFLQKILIVLITIYVIDNIVSLSIISSFKNVVKTFVYKDNTEEITMKVREILAKRGGLYKRLIYAFNFVISDVIIKNSVKIKENAEKQLKKIEMEQRKKSKSKKEILKKYNSERNRLLNELRKIRKEKRENLKKIK